MNSEFGIQLGWRLNMVKISNLESSFIKTTKQLNKKQFKKSTNHQFLKSNLVISTFFNRTNFQINYPSPHKRWLQCDCHKIVTHNRPLQFRNSNSLIMSCVTNNAQKRSKNESRTVAFVMFVRGKAATMTTLWFVRSDSVEFVECSIYLLFCVCADNCPFRFR